MLSCVVHDFLSVDEVAGLLDFLEHVPHVVVPLVEGLVRGLLNRATRALLENNYTLHSVDFCTHTGFLDNHVSELLLSEIDADTGELSETLKTDARVVLLDSADVVLNELTVEFLQMRGRILCL